MMSLLLLQFAALLHVIFSASVNCCSNPPNFPKNIIISRQDFQNWGGLLKVGNLWTAVPRTTDDLVTLANWAKENNYTMRARGRMHNWSPLAVVPTTDCRNTLMVDTTKHLTKMTVYPKGISNYPFPVITAESGVTLENLLTKLELYNLGLTSAAAIGSITIGGLFAIAGHGSAIRNAKSKYALKGYGSVVNRIVKMKVVAWDEKLSSYTLQTFDRSDSEISTLMTHLGLAFVASMTLRAEQNFYLSCALRANIPNKELYTSASTGRQVRTASSLIKNSSKIILMTFPFSEYSVILECQEVLSCHKQSKQLNEPYNWMSDDFVNLIYLSNLLNSYPQFKSFFSPLLNRVPSELVKISSPQNYSAFCGASKNLILYSKAVAHPNPISNQLFSYAVLTKQQDIQQVLYVIKAKLDSTLKSYGTKGIFPLNGYLEIRATELDDPNDIGPNARSSFLAPTSKLQKYPQFDTTLWFEFVTTGDSIGSSEFFNEMESYFHSAFKGPLGVCRPEWSKGWAFTEKGPWTNMSLIHHEIANSFDDWEKFICVAERLDPHNLFRNDFLNEIFTPKKIVHVC